MSQTFQGVLLSPFGTPVKSKISIYCVALLPVVVSVGVSGVSQGSESVFVADKDDLGAYNFSLENGTYQITIQIGSSQSNNQTGQIVVNSGATTDILTALATQAPAVPYTI